MGVPKFFRWISERYPCLSEVVREFQLPDFDNLYLDMNGIIHVCSHPNTFDPHFRITEEKIFKDIFHYIEILFRMIKPRKLFFLAVDGVAPRAKMNQQRGRRFRTAKEAELLEKKAQELGEALPAEARFDSNCITPGTVFMTRLQEQLKYFISFKVSTDKLWKKVKVILSGHEVPGEGEHKIMDYIRYMKSQPDYEPNTTHCLYGLDADLIMLGLCSHEPHFSLLREEVKFGRKGQTKRIPNPEEIKFYLLHLSLMRDYLELEFQEVKDKISFPFDLEKIIDDWVLMGFLVGNDFIPPLPELHIVNGALPILYKAYTDVLPTLDGYINENGTLNLPRFQKYMEKLAEFDYAQFRETYADLKFFESKTGRKLGSKERHSYLRNNNDLTDSKLDTSPEDDIATRNPELASLIQETNSLLLKDDNEDDIEDDYPFEVDDNDCEDDSEEEFRNDFKQHKRDYYMNKLEYGQVTQDVLRSQAEGYVRAIQWNLHYYYNGVCSWSWFYPHHYAPYISDIRNFDSLKLDFDMGKPFLPFQQLLAVLPSASKTLLPHPYQILMTDENSPIIDYYPPEFRTDLNGKKQEWEAVVLIPFIDEDILLSAMEPLNGLLTEEEKNRNSHGPMSIFTYSEENLGVYEAPGYFPNIPNNHAERKVVFREEIYVDPSELVRGLCSGVKMNEYMAGFPTLRHVQFTASLKKREIKVFDQPSRAENMILTITSHPSIDAEEIARAYIGNTIFVEWPHLKEAKVCGLSTRTSCYSLADDRTIIPQQPNALGHYTSQERTIRERYYSRFGVDIGESRILLHANLMTGQKYIYTTTGKVIYEKQWNKTPTPYALQVTVKDIQRNFKNVPQSKTIQELFEVGSTCFMLGHPHYGAMGEVLESATAASKGRIKVSMSTTSEPDLEPIHWLCQDSRVKYLLGQQAAQRLGISSHLLSRITGTIYIIPARNSESKVNVGLNLKFSKKNEEVPGYTRKENLTWLYSHKAVDLVQNYMKAFPELFDYLYKNTGNDMFVEEDIFPNSSPGEKISAISNWLKAQPHTRVERQPCGAEVLDPEVVHSIEKVVDGVGSRGKTVVMQVKPHLLFKPDIQTGNLPPDPNTSYQLLDRITSVREGYTVPQGLKGTIIGIQKTEKEADTLYDIIFDKSFPGGLSLNGCSNGRGYRLSRPSFINLSHGQRLEVQKSSNKPLSSQNGQIFNFTPPWNVNQQNQNRPSSAFAIWDGGIVPRVGSANAASPQPRFLENREASQQIESPNKNIIKFQDFAILPKPQTEPRQVPPPSTEFLQLWTKLQKTSNGGAPSAPVGKIIPTRPSVAQKSQVPSNVVAPPADASTEVLKKFLGLSGNSSSQTENKLQTPPMPAFRDHSESKFFQESSKGSVFCRQLLEISLAKGLGQPRYNWDVAEDNSIVATVSFRNSVSFKGDKGYTKEQACENAARCALAKLNPPPISKPNLPTPPQQWYQQHRIGSDQPWTFFNTHQSGKDRSIFPPPVNQPFAQPHSTFSNMQKHVQQYHTPARTNWRSEIPPSQGTQFVPLQAVRQQRNRPVRTTAKKASEDSISVPPQSSVHTTNNEETIVPPSTQSESKMPETSQSKPRVRKSRIAANFNVLPQ